MGRVINPTNTTNKQIRQINAKILYIPLISFKFLNKLFDSHLLLFLGCQRFKLNDISFRLIRPLDNDVRDSLPIGVFELFVKFIIRLDIKFGSYTSTAE